jgi:CBS domain containing-hemolysin-like protein
MYVEVLLLIGLLVLSAFFSATETAFFSFSKSELLALKKSNSARLRLVYRMMQKPNQVLTSLLLGNNFVNIMVVVVGAQLWSRLEFILVQRLRPPSALEEGFSTILEVFVLSGLLLFGGEIFPKSVALKYPRGVVRWNAIPFFLFHQVLGWSRLRLFASLSSKWLMRVAARILGNTKEQASSEDIQMAVELGEKEGHLSREEAQIIRNVLAVQDIPVSRLMVHRSWVHTLSPKDTVAEAIRLGMKNKWPQYPVYDIKKDQVVGVFDVEKAFYKGQKGRVRQFMRPPVFVSAIKTSEFLMDRLWEENHTLVVVLDEFGGYLGVLSTREIMDYLVKMGTSITEEVENRERSIGIVPQERGWNIEGSALVEDLETILETSFPRGDFRTVGGLLQWELGDIPQKGSCIVIHGWKFYVEVAKAHCVTSIFVPHKYSM